MAARSLDAHALRMHIQDYRTGAQSSSRLRSARGWIMRLAPCPRVCCYRQRAPFERTVARTCTWAVLRLTGVTLLAPFGAHAVPEASGARCRKDQPHPAPRIEDDRDAPSTGTGRAKDISPSHDVKNKIGTFQDYFF